MSAWVDAQLHRDVATPANAPSWLAAARREAAATIATGGLPGPRNEAWKYTSLRALERRTPRAIDAAAARRPIDASTFALPGIDGPRLVFVDGVFRDDLSEIRAIDGLSIATLARATPAELERWRPALTRSYGDEAEAFATLATALAPDGPLVRVAAGAHVDAPVHLVFIYSGDAPDVAWHSRASIDVGDDASLTLIEHHVGGGTDVATFGNVVAHAALGARARLDLVQIQDAADGASLIRRSEASIGDGAELRAHAIELGAALSRHDIAIGLDGARARFVSRGVFALRARQHSDIHLDIRHVARDTTSDIVWRGVADGRSRGVFHGAITVAAGADGADASLSNKNLLLSPNAEIDTQPVLEIHADEVKAAHGATVGQLDERALFYLRSRGLPPDEARRLLIAAFCASTLADIGNPDLRVHLDALLAARLPNAANDSGEVSA
jgi:Fe-S cluster assembly protein SufD